MTTIKQEKIKQMADNIVWIVNRWLPKGLRLSEEAEKALRGLVILQAEELIK